MKYDVVYKNDDKSIKLKEELINKINVPLTKVNPNIVFTIGGDGTVLDAVRKHLDNLENITFVSINTGNVGFYTEFLPSDIDYIISRLKDRSIKELLSYSLLEFNIDDNKNYALNEVTFSVTHHLFEAGISVDNTHLMDLRADGLCISTPSGSTAYNKSLKGAVVDPTLEVLQMVVIAPFETVDKRVISPLVVSKNRSIQIKPVSKYFDVSFDRMFVTYQNVKNMEVLLSNKKASFLKNKTQNFPKRLNEKFI